MAPRLRPMIAALVLGGTAGIAVGIAGCGDADVEERDRGSEVDSGDSYDPDDLDEREANE